MQVELQVGEDELLLNELPDDPSHFISLHLDHRACLDLLRHLKAWWKTKGTCTQTLIKKLIKAEIKSDQVEREH